MATNTALGCFWDLESFQISMLSTNPLCWRSTKIGQVSSIFYWKTMLCRSRCPWPHLIAEAAKHEDRRCLNVLCNYEIGHDAGKRQQRKDEALYFAVARGYDYDPVSRLLDAGANIHETLNWNLVGSKAVRQHFQGRVGTNA